MKREKAGVLTHAGIQCQRIDALRGGRTRRLQSVQSTPEHTIDAIAAAAAMRSIQRELADTNP
jgi:hypothetical protein